MYLIEILHQTTTFHTHIGKRILLYLIEILHQTTTVLLTFFLVVQLYLIEILHQTTTAQPVSFPLIRCILSKFYIKPQLGQWPSWSTGCCILSKFYIKPQLARQWLLVPCVVSYRNSTSNHNNVLYNTIRSALYLIEILHQTTTHNSFVLHILCCILSKFYIKPQHSV